MHREGSQAAPSSPLRGSMRLSQGSDKQAGLHQIRGGRRTETACAKFPRQRQQERSGDRQGRPPHLILSGRAWWKGSEREMVQISPAALRGAQLGKRGRQKGPEGSLPRRCEAGTRRWGVRRGQARSWGETGEQAQWASGSKAQRRPAGPGGWGRSPGGRPGEGHSGNEQIFRGASGPCTKTGYTPAEPLHLRSFSKSSLLPQLLRAGGSSPSRRLPGVGLQRSGLTSNSPSSAPALLGSPGRQSHCRSCHGSVLTQTHVRDSWPARGLAPSQAQDTGPKVSFASSPWPRGPHASQTGLSFGFVA